MQTSRARLTRTGAAERCPPHHWIHIPELPGHIHVDADRMVLTRFPPPRHGCAYRPSGPPSEPARRRRGGPNLQRLRFRWRRAAFAFARRLRIIAAGSRPDRPAPVTSASLTGATRRASRRIINAIPAISPPAAISPNSSTVLELELELEVEASVEAVLAVVAVDASLPPSVSSLKALPAPALAAAATGAHTRTGASAATANRQPRRRVQGVNMQAENIAWLH
jgi:hypothetical protein